jgi:serine/threonine protein phosphatase PrpC
MSTDFSFTSRQSVEKPLAVFLHQDHSRFVAEPARLLGPLIRCLDEMHQAGQAHSAVTPLRIHVAAGGDINLDFFKTCAGTRDPVEDPTYYPHGFGDSVDTRRQRDAQALGAVFHLIMTGQPPAPPQRGRKKIAKLDEAGDWPAAFVDLVDRLLAVGDDAGLPSLSELAGSLDGATAATETAAVAPPEAGELIRDTPEAETPAENVTPRPADVVRTLSSVRLPNGMVGRALDESIAAIFLTTSTVQGRIEMTGEVPAGLEFRNDRLTGAPEAAGEYEIPFRFFEEARAAMVSIPLQCTVQLTINPDPRSLWKNTPSDPQGEFWKPDSHADFLTDAPLTVLGASLRGRSHAHVGGFRDDDMAMAWQPADAWLSLTVADGAGSAKYSRRGSVIACETVKARIGEYFSNKENLLSNLLSVHAADPAVRNELYQLFGKTALEARKAIETQAAAVHATARDFHTTLITALLHPLGDGRWFIATFSIGDGGAAVVGVPGGDPCLLTRPEGGEYAGQTVFLTMPEALATGEAIMGRIRMAIVPTFEALILVTDGISDPRFDSEAAIADSAAWTSLWQELKQQTESATTKQEAAEAILKWMDFHSPGHHDDRTIVLATPTKIPPL